MNDIPKDNGFDAEALVSFVSRIESLQGEIDHIAQRAKEECEPIREDIAGIKREAHDAGIGKAELAAVIKRRRLEMKAAHAGDKLDMAELANYQAYIESLERLAAQVGPLGEAALDAARAGA